MLEQFKLQIYCPINYRTEMVYCVASQDGKTVFFNGCESSFHNCQTCRDCEQKVRASLSNPPATD